MLTIAVSALFFAVSGAIGIMQFEGTLFPIPFFSLKTVRHWYGPGKIVTALCGLILGSALGTVLAFGIGLFMPTHMVAAEEIELTPIHQDGNMFYVGVSAQEATGPRGAHYAVPYYSFLKEADGGMTLEKFRTDDSIKIYEDNQSGGKLIRLESEFLAKNDLLFAFPDGPTRYEFHVPPNSIGTF